MIVSPSPETSMKRIQHISDFFMNLFGNQQKCTTAGIKKLHFRCSTTGSWSVTKITLDTAFLKCRSLTGPSADENANTDTTRATPESAYFLTPNQSSWRSPFPHLKRPTLQILSEGQPTFEPNRQLSAIRKQVNIIFLHWHYSEPSVIHPFTSISTIQSLLSLCCWYSHVVVCSSRWRGVTYRKKIDLNMNWTKKSKQPENTQQVPLRVNAPSNTPYFSWGCQYTTRLTKETKLGAQIQVPSFNTLFHQWKDLTNLVTVQVTLAHWSCQQSV